MTAMAFKSSFPVSNRCQMILFALKRTTLFTITIGCIGLVSVFMSPPHPVLGAVGSRSVDSTIQINMRRRRPTLLAVRAFQFVFVLAGGADFDLIDPHQVFSVPNRVAAIAVKH